MSTPPIEAYLLQLGLLFGATYLLWRTLKSTYGVDIDLPSVASAPTGLQNVRLDRHELEIAKEIVSPEELAASGGFESIGGLDEQIAEIQRWVINALERPDLFSHSKLLQRPSSILLYGPPGSGKTMIARAIALRANATFINVDPATLFRPYVGSTEGLIRGLFSLARKLAPMIIFMDEIDGILSARGNSQSSSAHWSNTMKTQILQEWDGLNSWSLKNAHHYGNAEGRTPWVLIIGATNRPSSLDPAVLRRMPRQIEVPLPNETSRVQILTKLLESEHVCPNLDYDLIAKKTPGYSGSDLKELCREALMIPLTKFIEEKEEQQSAQPALDAVSDGDPTESDPSETVHGDSSNASTSLAVKGLPPATTDDFIKALAR